MFSPILATTGAGNVEVNASTDALVLSEYAATVSLDVIVTAATDALILTEYSATVEVSVPTPTVIDRGGAPIRRYHYIPEKRRVLTVRKKGYDEKELIRLIRLAAEKAYFEAAKKLEQKARLADNVEIAIVNFHDAFVKAEQQINDKYEKSKKRLIEVQEEMNEEEHLILQILLEAV